MKPNKIVFHQIAASLKFKTLSLHFQLIQLKLFLIKLKSACLKLRKVFLSFSFGSFLNKRHIMHNGGWYLSGVTKLSKAKSTLVLLSEKKIKSRITPV